MPSQVLFLSLLAPPPSRHAEVTLRVWGRGTGTMMLILGVVHFLRASDVSFLRKLRTSQFWITFEAFGFAFYGYVPYVHAPFNFQLYPNLGRVERWERSWSTWTALL